jgi:hypothetical protein
MTTQEHAFRTYYAAMSDSDLLHISANRVSFIGTAQRVLADELNKRHLTPSDPPVPAPHHSVFWNWGDQVTRWARRVRHHPASP